MNLIMNLERSILMRPLRVLHVLGGRMDLGGIEYFLMNYFRLINKEEVIFDFLITDLGKGFLMMKSNRQKCQFL